MPASQPISEHTFLAAPARKGLRAWLPVLVLLLSLLGQMLHVHPGAAQEPSGRHAALAGSSADEAVCPLCVAMHSATATPPVQLPEPFCFPAALPPALPPQASAAPPGHAHWSRPPPVQ